MAGERDEGRTDDELRRELERRELPTHGARSELLQRLREHEGRPAAADRSHPSQAEGGRAEPSWAPDRERPSQAEGDEDLGEPGADRA